MLTAVQFNFPAKQEKTILPGEIRAACEAGLFCWLDAQCEAGSTELDEVGKVLRDIGINDQAVSEVLGKDVEGRYNVYDDCLHFALTECRVENGRLVSAHVDIVLAARFIVTFRRHEVDFVRQMKRTYREDFFKFAQSPGFLLYEIGDHLIEVYRRTLREYSNVGEQIQLQLFGDVNDEIFRQVAELKSDILVFRKVLLASRELMHELATRKSPFISDTTQPFLENMAGTMERLGSDLSTERDVLSETLGLYMGMVGHRTNKVVSRLTVVSVIFLPLGFLVGVYGTNFSNIPGAAAPGGFFAFCLATFSLGLLFVAVMKRLKWL